MIMGFMLHRIYAFFLEDISRPLILYGRETNVVTTAFKGKILNYDLRKIEKCK